MTRTHIIILCLLIVTGVTGCNQLYFYPMQKHVMTPDKVGVVYEDVYLQMDDGIKLHGWYLPAQIEKKSTILFFHGNAENISTHFASVYWLPQFGYDVYLFDYRGYGWSQGSPAIDLVIDDAKQLIRAMNTKLHVPYNDLIVFGQSLGGAIAINAVATLSIEHKIKALVFDSAFSDFRKIAREKLGEFWLTWPLQWPLSYSFTGEYSPLVAIQSIEGIPVLGIHGESDFIIPIWHGEQLIEAANGPKQFWRVEQGRHIESMVKPAIRERFVNYLDSLNATAEVLK